MRRSYHHWYSRTLGRDRELLVFGHAGARALVFPTRCGRFFDFENWRLVEACQDAVESGRVQLFCVDSYDSDSVYADWMRPADRMPSHLRFERYILDEVVPFSASLEPGRGSSPLWAMGCSLGAWHALNLASRHPRRFDRVIGFSGRYDLTRVMGSYRDLFDGWYDQDIYFNTPSHFLPQLDDPAILSELRYVRVHLACGREDIIYDNNHALVTCLQQRSVAVRFTTCDGEAHRPRAWRPLMHEALTE
jgi:esterase/lipase superfamily enzyme